MAVSLLVFISIKSVFLIGLNILNLKIFLPIVSAISAYLIFTINKLYDNNYIINIRDALIIFFSSLIFSFLYLIFIYNLAGYIATVLPSEFLHEIFYVIFAYLPLFTFEIQETILSQGLVSDLPSTKGNSKANQGLTLSMEESNSNKGEGNQGSSSNVETSDKLNRNLIFDNLYGSFKELRDLNFQLKKFISQMIQLQRVNNAKIEIDSVGNMFLESPDTLSPDATKAICNKAGIIDRLFFTQSEKYESILNKSSSLIKEAKEKGFNLPIFKRLDEHTQELEATKKAYEKALNNDN